MKKKLKLKDIEVESFITSMEEKEKATIDGAGSVWGICLKSFGDACVWTPIQIEQTALCIPDSYDQGACTLFVCTDEPMKMIPPDQCSAFRRGSCGGTLG